MFGGGDFNWKTVQFWKERLNAHAARNDCLALAA